MLTYDTILTLPLEVEKIWSRKYTVVTVLWFLVSTIQKALLACVLRDHAEPLVFLPGYHPYNSW